MNSDSPSPEIPLSARFPRWPWLAAVASGLLLSLAYPDWDVPAMVWFWIFPLLAALWGPAARVTPGRAFALGWLAGFACHFLVLRWLRDIHAAGNLSLLGWVLLPAYLACFTGLWSLFAATVGRLAKVEEVENRFSPAAAGLRAAAINAAAWVFLEWFRGWFLGGFGWNGLGVPMQANAAMVQMAEITGASGLSFLPVFLSIGLYSAAMRIHQRVRKGQAKAGLNLDFTATMALVVIWFLFGAARLVGLRPPENAEKMQVLILQRNIPQDLKWDPALALDHVRGYLDAAARAFEENESERQKRVEAALAAEGEIQINLAPVEWILMPESALPFYLYEPVVDEFRTAMRDIAGGNTAIVTGINDAEIGETPKMFNTIAVLSGEADPITYRKRNLVPFGEYLPLRWFPPMEWLAGEAVPGDFTPGDSTEPLVVRTRAGEVEILPAICFEDTLGRHTRLFVRSGRRQVIVNTTNDGWFADPAAALQHAANARLRCIETRRPMVRAANTGWSGVIDRTGVVRAEIIDTKSGSPQIAGTLIADVELDKNPPLTFHTRFGDVFSFACGFAALLGILLHWRPRPRP
ncbi:MAG: apolipoprotein N-acyltransferase [Verrucomicrobiales bacterium]